MQNDQDFAEAAEDFYIGMISIANMPSMQIKSLLITGSYIYNLRQNLYWFEHVIQFDTCVEECSKHRFWATVVGDMREFDAITQEKLPYGAWGLRVVDDPKEAINGTWIDGVVHR